MSAFSGIIFVRGVVAVAGLCSLYFGYRLFYVANETQGRLNLQLGVDRKLTISNLAPGIYFALFGSAILITCAIYPSNPDEQGNRDRLFTVARPVFSQPISSTPSAPTFLEPERIEHRVIPPTPIDKP